MEEKVTDEPDIILSFLKTVRNSIKIYMFRDHSWMMQIRKQMMISINIPSSNLKKDYILCYKF